MRSHASVTAGIPNATGDCHHSPTAEWQAWWVPTPTRRGITSAAENKALVADQAGLVAAGKRASAA
jgi:hypothetical protein